MYLLIFSDPFFARTFLGNPLESYLLLITIILAGFLFKQLISKFLSRQLYRLCKKYSSGVGPNKLIELLMAPFNLFLMLLIFFLAFGNLEFPLEWNLAPKESFGFKMVLFKSYMVLFVISVTWIFLRFTDYFGLVLSYRASLTSLKNDDQLVPFIKESIKIILAIFSLFFILGSIFEVNVASLIAGLGIGGLAIALAAKESIENLLGSFTIFLDKPFTIGDLIKVGNITGHVEKIGFRSTRIRTQDKTFVTVPNKKMVDAELENLTLRDLTRAMFTIGLTYDTSEQVLKNIVSDIKKMLATEQKLTDDYSINFADLTSGSLDILIIYFVKTGAWEEFIAVKEQINYNLMHIVHKNGCTFAYPTTRVLLDKIIT